ncbi:MAG: ferredoxin family protein [Coriobacteriales bacterium]|nr:ferredoxin family protein [Coriobacteriales bacterium]
MYGPPVAFHGNRHTIKIDPDLCTGCWRCQQECLGQNVIGRTEIDGRPKAYVKFPDHCKGCMTCLRNCLTNAIKVITTAKEGFMPDVGADV